MAKSTDAGTPKQKKTRWYHQVWQAYKMTTVTDPAVTWWMLGVFVGIMVLGVLIGVAWGPSRIVYMTVVAVPFALLGAMFTLTRRAERAAYARLEGQQGAAWAALSSIRRGGWSFAQEPVAVDPRSQDLVFRGIGRPGVVLVGEAGPRGGRPTKVLDAERKRHARVLPNVPITVIEVGRGEGQVPLAKLALHVQKMRPSLTKPETAAVAKRLTALGGAKLPMPKGIDPMRVRPDRKGVRGR